MDKYYSAAVTWCSNVRCKTKSCERNQIHRRPSAKPYSVADFENTIYCVKNIKGDMKNGSYRYI